jgi:N-acylneuraminate cytidylyltransferase
MKLLAATNNLSEANLVAPFLRSASLYDDYTGIEAVIARAIEWLQEKRVAIDLACCTFATVPFVRAEDLKSSLTQVEAEDADYFL